MTQQDYFCRPDYLWL